MLPVEEKKLFTSARSDAEAVKIPVRMYLTACLVASQSFLYGYGFASLNSCLVLDPGTTEVECYEGTASCPPGSLFRSIELNVEETQLATSTLILGAWVGCVLASRPSELYGRRKTLIYNSIFFLAGGVLCAIGDKPALFLGRIIVGFGIGVESVVVPTLLSEIAEPSSRGTITIFHQILLVSAIFLVSVVSYGCVMHIEHGWQYVQAGTCFPAIFMLVLMKYIPESPKWLLRKGLRSEAEQTLLPLRPEGHNIAAEVDEILLELSSSPSSPSSLSTNGGKDDVVTWSDLMKS